MKAIVFDRPGGSSVLHLADVEDPVAMAGEVTVRVAAAGVNRADVFQRMGFYPPPPGASPILGLEVSGEIDGVGAGVTRWRRGDRVMALLDGGGYAQRARVAQGQVMHVPNTLDAVASAAIPEVFIAAHDSLTKRASLQPGETVLIHGGAGGVGTAAIQVATSLGATVIVTTGSGEKMRRCADLGAAHAISYRTEDFVARTRGFTAGHGVDVILDVMGAEYFERNVNTLASDGRLVIISHQGGTIVELNIAMLAQLRGTVFAPRLRSRPAAQKARIVADFTDSVLPLLADGRMRPVVHRVFPLAEAAAAHDALDSDETIGKIVLDVASA